MRVCVHGGMGTNSLPAYAFPTSLVYLYMPHGQSAQSHCELRAPGGAARPGGHRVAEHCLLGALSARPGGASGINRA
jgi:hypothetical protein